MPVVLLRKELTARKEKQDCNCLALDGAFPVSQRPQGGSRTNRKSAGWLFIYWYVIHTSYT